MAGILDSKIISGKAVQVHIESDKNSLTMETKSTVNATVGKTTASVVTGEKFAYTTYEGGTKLTESKYTQTSVESSPVSVSNAGITKTQTESKTIYNDGASTVSSVSESTTYRDGKYTVEAEQSKKTATNTAGDLEGYSEKTTVAEQKQKPSIIKNAEFEVKELVLAEAGKSTKVEKSVYSVSGATESDNGSTQFGVSVLNAEAHADAKVTMGTKGFKAEAKAGASASAFEAEGSVEYGAFNAQGDASLLKAETNATAKVKAGSDGIEASLNVGASVTVAEANGTVSVGDGNLGLEVGAGGRVLSAEAGAEAKIGFAKNEKTGEYELNAVVSAEVNAVLVEGTVNTEVSLAGVDVGAEAGVYIGVGAKVKIGIENNKFVFDISAALGIGFSLKFSIGFNDGFLKNIKKIYSYPGMHYASNNPYIKADTAKLRSYATRIRIINNRLQRLDDDLDSLYWQVGFLDLVDILSANIQIGKSKTLSKVESYLENAAKGFESADETAYANMGGT